ncbi:PepSY domain-containing protein [Paenibacillus tritici]|uniref:PepSY domain-containing protein n=1 Tax=Paenibacillus tritici TaxID=1873425 RepID=A0ABX2DT38_9BACL|nr:PepSY domain-containing protein [Paenibacillus tritici]NQX47575.1 PepSY domain-containing protein [Paenibacillus tritici]QUL55775.1 PepSY domain-containing protein [Paenibacillus tritici]
MNKKIWSSMAAAALILGGAYGIGEVRGGTAEAAAAVQSQSKTLIGISKAEQIALKAAPGQVENIDLEKKAGSMYYDIEIQQTKQETEVRVDAYTGKVISVRKDADDDRDDNNTAATAPSGKMITAARAAEVAAASVKGTVAEIDLDRDHGGAVYEVEIRNGQVSTEVGVDAYTAKIVYTDVDSEGDDD